MESEKLDGSSCSNMDPCLFLRISVIKACDRVAGSSPVSNASLYMLSSKGISSEA